MGLQIHQFGGVISETITDIGISLLLNDFWDHSKNFDPISNQLNTPISLPESVPFHAARDLAVNILRNDHGKIDIYIDDSIGVAPDIEDVPSRVVRAIPLAIRSFARLASDDDVIPRKDIISLKKLNAEGSLQESKTILGWVINSRSLQISLPDQKLHGWVKDIDTILSSKKSSYQLLEMILGRLNHVACVFLPM